MKTNQQIIDLLTRRAEKAEAKLTEAADYASALSDDLDRKKAEIIDLREASQAIFKTDLLSVEAVIERNKEVEAEIAEYKEYATDMENKLKQLHDYAELLDKGITGAEEARAELADLREAVAHYFECKTANYIAEDQRSLGKAAHKLRKMIGGGA